MLPPPCIIQWLNYITLLFKLKATGHIGCNRLDCNFKVQGLS
jgi:hypothetical protein